MDKYTQAFPIHIARDEKNESWPETHLGLNKRELFAAMSKPSIEGYSIDFISKVMGTPAPPAGIERVMWINAFEAQMKIAEADALICALDMRKPSEYIPSNLNPAAWWTDRGGEMHADPLGNVKIGRLYRFHPDDDVQARGERMIACVKAMEGIDNPEAWREQLIQLLQNEIGTGATIISTNLLFHHIRSFGKK